MNLQIYKKIDESPTSGSDHFQSIPDQDIRANDRVFALKKIHCEYLSNIRCILAYVIDI